MLRQALVMGFKNESGNLILYTFDELQKMYLIANSTSAGLGKIPLIKELRTQHGLGLAEAKDFVDAVCFVFDHHPKPDEQNLQQVVGAFYYHPL